MSALRISAALLLPVGIALIYAPLHKGWLVQMFGCACVGARGFNASTLSFLIHGLAAGSAGVLLWRAATPFPRRQRANTLAFGAILLGALWIWFWQHDCVA